MVRLLSSYLHADPQAAAADPLSYAARIRNMADADSTEVEIAGYLTTLEERYFQEHPAKHRRAVAMALWHVAKCAEVRDRAQRLLEDRSRAAT